MASALLLVLCIATVSADARAVNNYPSHHIVGGKVAPPHAFPWMVAMYYQNRFTCGGSYIQGNNGRSYVLTAAHCTEGKRSPNQWTMRLGRHNININEASGQDIVVERIIDHDSYSSRTLDWDVSLLQLTSNPINNQYVSPISLAASDFTNMEMTNVSGWGALTEGGASPSQLQYVEKPILSHDTCRSQLGSNNYKDSNMLCAGFEAGGVDACQGDSGGPLFALRGSRQEVIGIVSWGFGCARPMLPGVYSNVFKSRDWINGHINSN